LSTGRGISSKTLSGKARFGIARSGKAPAARLDDEFSRKPR
jgi:hypothetical protein